MAGISGLPGFDAVLREHKRLASKLTSDELRAIRDYVDERLRQEQAAINFRLYALRNDYDVTVRRSSETISDLYQELSEKKEIIKHYQSSDQNISSVVKQKEQRWEKKQELLMTEIEKLEGEATRAKAKLKHVESDLEMKCKDVKELEEKLDEANKAIEMVEEAKTVLKERDERTNELLKLKLEVDKRDIKIQNQERSIQELRKGLQEFDKGHKFSEMKVTAMQDELRRQVGEVADKCKDLSQLQFQLQMEKRQTETLQKQLRHATDEVQNFRRMLESSCPPINERDPTAIILKKDLDIMDIRIRSLESSVRLRLDESKKLAGRLEDVKNEQTLVGQIKAEVFNTGNTYLELAISDLLKQVDFRHKRLKEEFKYAQDWESITRDADVLRSEVTALMKQAAICKMADLSNRAAKQQQKIDLIMRSKTDTVKMPRIYKVSDRRNSDNRNVKKQKQTNTAHRPAFLTSSTPISAFDSSSFSGQSSYGPRKRVGLNRTQSYHQRPVLENHTDDTKLQYIDTVELELSGVNPVNSSRPGNQTDRMTLKSVSTGTIPALSE